MRQRRWLELIKDYDLEVYYHPGKANVVADALSRKAHGHCHNAGIRIIKLKLSQEEAKYKCFHIDPQGVLWFNKRLVVPKDHQLRKQILDEAHLSKFSIHPGSSKMYQDL
jgi:hypothetical protein